jgi:hypothetical protein
VQRSNSVPAIGPVSLELEEDNRSSVSVHSVVRPVPISHELAKPTLSGAATATLGAPKGASLPRPAPLPPRGSSRLGQQLWPPRPKRLGPPAEPGPFNSTLAQAQRSTGARTAASAPSHLEQEAPRSVSAPMPHPAASASTMAQPLQNSEVTRVFQVNLQDVLRCGRNAAVPSSVPPFADPFPETEVTVVFRPDLADVRLRRSDRPSLSRADASSGVPLPTGEPARLPMGNGQVGLPASRCAEHCEPHSPPARTETDARQRRRSHRVRLVLVVLMGVALGALVALAPLVPAWVTAVAHAWSGRPPVPAYVRLSISANPPETRLFLDGVPVNNPLELQRHPDDGVHALRAEARGHKPIARALRFERDLTVQLELTPSRPATGY